MANLMSLAVKASLMGLERAQAVRELLVERMAKRGIPVNFWDDSFRWYTPLEYFAHHAAKLGIEEDAEVEAAFGAAMAAHAATAHSFEYVGTNHTHVCQRKIPHAPHVVGDYVTPIQTLQFYCCGKEGPGVKVVVVKRAPGSAERASFVQGYYHVNVPE